MPVTANERAAEEVFRGYKRVMIRALGRRATYGDQLDAVGRDIFGHQWGGVWHLGNFVPRASRSGRYYIVNTSRTDGSPGYHWLAAYSEPDGETTIWDSFGRNVRQLAWPIFHRAYRLGLIAVPSDRDAQQRGASQVCGQQSLAWLMTVHDIGIDRARLV